MVVSVQVLVYSSAALHLKNETGACACRVAKVKCCGKRTFTMCIAKIGTLIWSQLVRERRKNSYLSNLTTYRVDIKAFSGKACMTTKQLTNGQGYSE